MERTLIIIKPDGVQRALVGEVIKRFEARGLRIAGLKLMHISRELAEEHQIIWCTKDPVTAAELAAVEPIILD